MEQRATRDFHHPYEPYDIQLEFMSALYDCLDRGQVGIFESPTGTGKSLSIICGALTWLRDCQANELAGGVEAEGDEDEPAWVTEHAKTERLKRALVAKEELESRLQQIREKERQQRRRLERDEPPFKRTKLNTQADQRDADANADLDAFALEDYDSDGENGAASTTSDGLSSETIKLLERAGMVLKPESDDEALEVTTKIFYCSRTHSQLTQFANEVARVTMPPAFTNTPDLEPEIAEVAESIKLLSLGARKNLCINPRVVRLGTSTAINERCLELQQPKTPKHQKCPFVPTRETESLVHDFRDHTLAGIKDIEDLGRLGKELEICPYYASRATINQSEIVTLPYPLLLQKSAREALGISLKGHIVIIDEAHNLMNAIEGIYSVSLSVKQLGEARGQLTTYLQKFRNKLKGKNRVYVTQVVRLIDSLTAYLTTKASDLARDGIVDMANLMTGKGVDQINLHKLCRYLQESRLARKVAGYTTFVAESEVASTNKTGQQKQQRGQKLEATAPILMQVESFFYALANPTAEGRFFHERDDQGQYLKYMLLDPSERFRDVVEEARAVVLAGGTMSPMDDYIHHLFPYLPVDKTRILSCGHVIPKANLLACPITQHDGVEFDFTFSRRNTHAVLNALGSAILKLAHTVPHGLVVFFASYAYLEQVIQHWKKGRPGSSSPSLFEQMSACKPVFSERKDTNVEKLFADYSSQIGNGPNGRGATLFAVIGGKLSEGINFSDDLGRCVAVVGLPFPNSQTAEWRTKLEHIENSAVARGQTAAQGKALSREYYENACMRAVNQSIGRAIRHKGDYASIVLLDKRYTADRIKSKLPGWIMSGMVDGTGNKDVWSLMRDFFETRK